MYKDVKFRSAGKYVATSGKINSMEVTTTDSTAFNAKNAFGRHCRITPYFMLFILISLLTMVKPVVASDTVIDPSWQGTIVVFRLAPYIEIFATSEAEIDAMIASKLPVLAASAKQSHLDYFKERSIICPIREEMLPVAGRDSGVYWIYFLEGNGSNCPYQGVQVLFYSKRFIGKQYTIALSGGIAVEPWHKKHDPEHLKANLPYKAIVKDQNGQPKADFAVTITTDVTSDSGGHVHTNARPKGMLVEQAGTGVKTKDGKVEIKGKTNGSGVFEFTFGAEEASGTHTLTAKCDSGCQAPATATVDVKVEGLEQIPDGASFYTLTRADGSVIGSTSTHKENHFLTPDAATILLNMASSYHAEIQYWAKPPKGKKPVPPLPLHLNDASLVGGGIFDIDADWDEPHEEHRRGTVIDIQANSKTGAIPSNNFIKFIDLAKHYGVHAKIHSPGSDNQHFHVRLLNRKE